MTAPALSQVQRSLLAEMKAGRLVTPGKMLTAFALERLGLIRPRGFRRWQLTPAGAAIDTQPAEGV